MEHPRGHSAKGRSKLRAGGRGRGREVKKVRSCRAGAAASANDQRRVVQYIPESEVHSRWDIDGGCGEKLHFILTKLMGPLMTFAQRKPCGIYLKAASVSSVGCELNVHVTE